MHSNSMLIFSAIITTMLIIVNMPISHSLRCYSNATSIDLRSKISAEFLANNTEVCNDGQVCFDGPSGSGCREKSPFCDGINFSSTDHCKCHQNDANGEMLMECCCDQEDLCNDNKIMDGACKNNMTTTSTTYMPITGTGGLRCYTNANNSQTYAAGAEHWAGTFQAQKCAADQVCFYHVGDWKGTEDSYGCRNKSLPCENNGNDECLNNHPNETCCCDQDFCNNPVISRDLPVCCALPPTRYDKTTEANYDKTTEANYDDDKEENADSSSSFAQCTPIAVFIIITTLLARHGLIL